MIRGDQLIITYQGQMKTYVYVGAGTVISSTGEELDLVAEVLEDPGFINLTVQS